MTDFIAAECAIRQLHARFVDAVFRKDADAFGDCFAKDGEWKIAGLHMRGRAEIAGTFGKLLGICARVQIILGPPLLDVGQGTATGRIGVTELAKMKDGSSAMTIGIYYDRYVEEDGRWDAGLKAFVFRPGSRRRGHNGCHRSEDDNKRQRWQQSGARGPHHNGEEAPPLLRSGPDYPHVHL